jgi:uroporphyrinogen-III synthase
MLMNRLGTTAGCASKLAEEVFRVIAPATAQELLFVCGESRRDELPQALRAAGRLLLEVPVYRSVDGVGKPTSPHRLSCSILVSVCS